MCILYVKCQMKRISDASVVCGSFLFTTLTFNCSFYTEERSLSGTSNARLTNYSQKGESKWIRQVNAWMADEAMKYVPYRFVARLLNVKYKP